MKRFFKFSLASILIVVFSFGIFKVSTKYNLNILYDEIDLSIYIKGCIGATGLDMDKEGNLYVSFKDNIRKVSVEGKESLLLKNEKLNIYDFLYDENNVYIATDNRVLQYNIENDEYKELMLNLPNLGLNKEIKLLKDENKLYVAIGSNTNSGIVDEKGLPCDRPSISFKLNGINYGENKTGAFKEFGISTSNGEKAHDNGQIGNGTLMLYDLKENQVSIFSYGVRNIEGIDITSDKKIFSVVGGMENVGSRPIMDDLDYIYELKESAWYGWPDFSGGDPITSPRFTDGSFSIKSILKEYPNKTPQAPIYEHSAVSSLRGLAIDKEGSYLKKDQIIFGDNKTHKIFALNDKRAIPIGTLDKDSFIEKIIINNNGIFLLDSGEGCVYKFSQKGNAYLFNLSPVYWIFATTLFIVVLVIISFKNREINRK